MRTILAFMAFSLLFTSVSASAANPVMPFSSLSKKRGFESIVVYNCDETELSDVRVTLQPDVFLEHFEHAFPQNRSQCHVHLQPKFGTEIRGVSVALGVFKVSKEAFSISFTVPTEHLKEYELWFSCSITWGRIPVLGGETYTVSLDDLRRAKQAVLETDPIWEELAATRSSSGVKTSLNPLGKHNPEQDVAPQSATRAESESEGIDQPQPESKERSQ